MTIKVKPLVWTQEPRNGWKVGVVYARCYHIIRRDDGWHLANAFGFSSGAVFPDIEAAKAAAQADHEARILSAIEAVDPATIRINTLREAANLAEKHAVKWNSGDGFGSNVGRTACSRLATDILALIDKEQNK